MANLFRLRVNVDYLRFLLKRNRRFILLMTIAMMVLNPILWITIETISSASTGVRITAQVFNLILLIASSFLLPFLLNGYMNRKKDLDVYHALPIKQTDLLITHMTAAWILMVIPFTLSWFVGGAIALDASYTFMNLLEVWASSLMISSALLSLVFFTMTQTGTSLDGFLYSALLTVLPIITYGATLAFRSIVFLGFNSEYSMRVIGLLFPIWSIFENAFASNGRYFDSALLNGVYWLVMALILDGVSISFYRRRKHELAESPFTSGYFFPIIASFFVSVVIFILYSIFYSESGLTEQSFYAPINFLFPFTFAGIVYLVMDVISQRSFKNLFKAMLRYLIIAAVTFSLLLMGLFSKGFGTITKIPSMSEIESVTLEVMDYSGLIFPPNSALYSQTYDESIDEFNLTDEASIQIALDLHQVILDEFSWVNYSVQNRYLYDVPALTDLIESQAGYSPSYKAYPYDLGENYYGSMNVSFVYHLKSGSALARTYTVPYAWTQGLTSLISHQDVLKRIAPNVVYKDKYSFVKTAKIRNPYNESTNTLSNFDLIAFSEAYTNDFNEVGAVVLNNLSDQAYAYVQLNTCESKSSVSCVESTLMITHTMTRSMAYLESLNASLPSLDVSNLSAVLVLMDENEQDLTHFRANGFGADLFAPYQENKLTRYVELTPEQIAQILPYTTNVGRSDMALPSVKIFAYSSEYNSSVSQGNALVMPQFVELVQAIIQTNPVKTTQDLNSLGSLPLKD